DRPTIRAETGHRSTRAGTRVPATDVRRPARHRAGLRSTRAGTRVPATDLVGGGADGVEVERSTRAGTRVPATDLSAPVRDHRPPVTAQRGPGLASRQRRSTAQPPAPWTALNEGRDSRPGNGQPVVRVVRVRGGRSTRAGTR